MKQIIKIGLSVYAFIFSIFYALINTLDIPYFLSQGQRISFLSITMRAIALLGAPVSLWLLIKCIKAKKDYWLPFIPFIINLIFLLICTTFFPQYL